MENTKTLKIGANKRMRKGKQILIPRLWIEGKFLKDNGWNHKDTYSTEYVDNKLLMYRKDKDGNRAIAGGVDRPIIDSTSHKLNDVGFQIGDTVSIEITKDLITVTKQKA